MKSSQLLIDAYGRVAKMIPGAVNGLSAEDLEYRIDPEANTVAWLIWHLTRIQDDHVAHVAGHEQVWTADGWDKRFGLPFDSADHGFGHSSADVAQVKAPADLLVGYHDAVHQKTVAFLGGLEDSDLDRVVDTRWDPPVTLAGRLVSVLSDNMQHVGQSLFIRGIVERRAK